MPISAKIPLKVEQEIISEGEHTFTIQNVDYDPTTGKLIIDLTNEENISHREYYNTLGNDGKFNSKAIGAFNNFVNSILDGYEEEEEIDPSVLIGVKFVADVVHSTQESRKNIGKLITFANLQNYRKPLADIDDDLPF